MSAKIWIFLQKCLRKTQMVFAFDNFSIFFQKRRQIVTQNRPFFGSFPSLSLKILQIQKYGYLSIYAPKSVLPSLAKARLSLAEICSFNIAESCSHQPRKVMRFGAAHSNQKGHLLLMTFPTISDKLVRSTVLRKSS